MATSDNVIALDPSVVPRIAMEAKDGFDPRNRHPDYNKAQERWQTAHDVYMCAEGVLPHAKDYVPRRMAGESEKAYDERVALLHVPGLTGALVDSIVGLWARKSPEEEDWGQLGPEDDNGDPVDGSVAKMLSENADRERTTWDNHRRGSATWICVYNKVFSLVDTNRMDDGGELTREQAAQMGIRPFVRLVHPLNVTDWIEKDGMWTEAVIMEGADPRMSLDDGKGVFEERYLRLKLDGWERYRVVKIGESEKIESMGTGTYQYLDASTGQPRLPLVQKVLPMPRHAAYNLALIERAIINHDSHLDALERSGALGQYLAVQGDEEDVRKNVKEGDKVLPYPPNSNAPEFIGHGMEPAPYIESRIEALTARFWQSAMYEFSDRTAQKTATEIEQEWASGIGAFLTLLAGALEEGENEEKALLAQAVGETDGGHTKFAKNYKVEDVIAEIQRLKDLIFGAGDPIPLSAPMQAAVASYMVRRLDSQAGLLSEAEDMDVDAELQAEADRKALNQQRGAALAAEAATQPAFPEEQA